VSDLPAPPARPSATSDLPVPVAVEPVSRSLTAASPEQAAAFPPGLRAHLLVPVVRAAV
jgi:hypothetical protein